MPGVKFAATRVRATVVLADDHRETAEQLRKLLQPHFDVVALVSDGSALVGAAAQLEPDVIVADVTMPLLDGIDAAKAIRRHDPTCANRVRDRAPEVAVVERALAAGALGYVVKDAAADELVPAIHSALRGERRVTRMVDTGR